MAAEPVLLCGVPGPAAAPLSTVLWLRGPDPAGGAAPCRRGPPAEPAPEEVPALFAIALLWRLLMLWSEARMWARRCTSSSTDLQAVGAVPSLLALQGLRALD